MLDLVVFTEEFPHIPYHLLWTFHARKVASKVALYSLISIAITSSAS